MAEAGNESEELARTATAAPGSPAPAEPIGDTLGRYRLERRLGEGGMGVVHCAFDPDLERRVALKVLRRSDGHDARQRLLREARAMARLQHPNVVAVHEVGTAGDRDYVAMELVDGETLADWLKAGRRSAHEITQAFIAAGRGLAAAHSAGLVHRDFKPHNVLRAHDSRVVVTDFGLARGVDTTALSFETTLRPDQAPDASPSSLTGLTATGSVLGTPAYMAPEQWDGGTVGPAADQFAFCVALWEALAGERPFKGQTLEELKRDVHRGVEALDVSHVPRRLRAPLRRGLQRDPAGRFPNMDALLAALVRADRRSSVASIAWRGALVVGVLGFVLLRSNADRAPACEPPPVALGSVWSPAISGVTPSALVAPFDKLAVRWTMARATACTADPGTREAQLRCLDGVLARFADVRQAYSRVLGASGEAAASELVDPAVCLAPSPPRLALGATSDATTAFELLAGADTAETGSGDPRALAKSIQTFVARPDLEPCTRTVALRALAVNGSDFATTRGAIADAAQHLDACEDDRVRAEVLVEEMPYEYEVPIGPRGLGAIERAERAVARVPQISLTSGIDAAHAQVASEQERWPDVFAREQRTAEALEAEGFQRMALHTAIDEIDRHYMRSRPEDMLAIRALVAQWLPIARAERDGKRVQELELDDAFARYLTGDLAAAHADIVRLAAEAPPSSGPTQRIDGTVVDAAGKPVAGAHVYMATQLIADSIGVLPLHRDDDGSLRQTTTDAAGRFVIPDGPQRGAIVAIAGDRRSLPLKVAEHAKLVLAPTRTLSGHVTLGGLTPTEIAISVLTEIGSSYVDLGLVGSDGSFAMSGVPTSKIGVAVEDPQQFGATIKLTQLPAGTAPIADLALQPPPSTGRALDVLVRSTLDAPIETAQVFVLAGHVNIPNAAALNAMTDNGVDTRMARHVVGESVPRPVLDQMKSGDLWASFASVPTGDITVCSLGLPGNLMDRDAMRKMMAHLRDLEMACLPLDGAAKVIVVPTAPPKRID